MFTNEQIQNINNFDTEKVIELLHICAEHLGAVTVEDYSEIYGIPKRTIYDKMNKKKIKFIQISKTKYPIVNE